MATVEGCEIVIKGKVAERLGKLGFKRAAGELTVITEKKRKLALAYEHYKFVTPENVAKFNAALRAKTGKNLKDVNAMEYQVLDFVLIENYEKAPPEEVLMALEVAQDRKCFDTFEVAYIKNVKDPLLFGRVYGTPNRFFIAQWDNDVSITDLIKENEG